jgi:hypothetical protein
MCVDDNVCGYWCVDVDSNKAWCVGDVSDVHREMCVDDVGVWMIMCVDDNVCG